MCVRAIEYRRVNPGTDRLVLHCQCQCHRYPRSTSLPPVPAPRPRPNQWSGDDCGQLRLAPATHGSGYNLTGQTPPTYSYGMPPPPPPVVGFCVQYSPAPTLPSWALSLLRRGRPSRIGLGLCARAFAGPNGGEPVPPECRGGAQPGQGPGWGGRPTRAVVLLVLSTREQVGTGGLNHSRGPAYLPRQCQLPS